MGNRLPVDTFWAVSLWIKITDLSKRCLFFIILWDQNCPTINIFSIAYLFKLFLTETLKVSCLHDAPRSPNTLYSSYKQRHFLYNHNATTKTGKLTLMHCYQLIHRLYQNFVNCSKNVLYSKRTQSRIMCSIFFFACLFSLLQTGIASWCFLVFQVLVTFE